MLLRQSTAVDVLIGPFVDSTDGYTPESGVSPAVKLSKAGQTLAAKTDATTPVHDADGYYNCELDATDTNTIGTLVLSVVGSATSLAVRHEFQVVEEAVYDAMYAASAAGPLQSTVAGRTIDITATGAAGIDWANVENPTTAVDLSGTDIQLCDTITAYTGNTPQTADHTTAIADLPTNAEFNARTLAAADYFDWTTDTVSQVSTVNTVNSVVGTVSANMIQVSGDAVAANNLESDYDGTGYAKANSTIGTCTDNTDLVTAAAVRAEIDSNSTQLAAIVADTGEIGTAGAGLTDLGGMSTAMKAEVNAEVADVLKTDTIADRSAGLPPATPTFEEAIAYLYSSTRNSIDVDSGFKEFYNDAGALIWKKALSDDGSNYVEAKSVAP